MSYMEENEKQEDWHVEPPRQDEVPFRIIEEESDNA